MLGVPPKCAMECSWEYFSVEKIDDNPQKQIKEMMVNENNK